MTGFGDEMRRLMAVRGISLRALAKQIHYDLGYLSKVMNGHKRPSAEVASRLDDVLGSGRRLTALVAAGADRRDVLRLGIAASVTTEALGRVLEGAAAKAMEFTRLAGVSAVGRGVFDHLGAVIAGIDRAYSTQPPAGLFPVARSYRARVEELASGPCTLGERRDLYIFAAWLSEALAWLAHDLGHPVAAEAYAIDSYEHAEQAGHDELCAWAADAMSSVALYTGRLERAGAAARMGISKAPSGHPLAVRLRAQAARAHARLGERGECESLLASALTLYDRLPSRPPTRSGTDTGVLASYAVTAYPASCYVWLGNFAKAASYGRRAVGVHESAPGESRSPSREAIARIALAGLGSADEAAALGLQALSSPRVVDSVRSRAADLDAVLTRRYGGQAGARYFHERYRDVAERHRAITS